MLQVAKSCTANGAASCETHAVDLSEAAAVESFAKSILSTHKRVDVLVNNAGMGTAGKNTGPLEGLSLVLSKIKRELPCVLLFAS